MHNFRYFLVLGSLRNETYKNHLTDEQVYGLSIGSIA